MGLASLLDYYVWTRSFAHPGNVSREIGLLLCFWLGGCCLAPGDVIFVLLAFPLNYIIFCLHQEQLT
jgi:hypothetical protein